MARAHWVASSRKPHRCHQGHDIPVGEGYYWAAPGFRTSRYGKKFACKRHPFRQSQLTSGLRSEALAAAEAFEDALDSIDTNDATALDDLRSAVEEFAGEIQGYADQRQEALDAWENGNSQLEDLLNLATDALYEIENWEPDEWDGDEEARDDEQHDDHADAIESWSIHVSDQIEAARDLAGLEF